MAITTLDGAIAGMKPIELYSKALSGTLVAGRAFSPFYLAGIPGAAVAPTPGAAGAALTAYSGQIPIPTASGNTHLARASFVSSAHSALAEIGIHYKQSPIDYSSVINALQAEIQQQQDDDMAIATLVAMLI